MISDYINLKLVRMRGADQWSWTAPSPAESSDRHAPGLVFVFVKSGLGQFVSGVSRLLLSPGGILVLNRSVSGSFSAVNDGEVVFWSFSAAFEHLVPLFDGYQICKLPAIIERFRSPRVYGASSRLARECYQLLETVPSQFSLAHRGQLLCVIAAILSEELKSVESHPSGFDRVEERMLRVFEQLSPSDLMCLSVKQMAAKLGCSRRHLGRLFHKHFGTSVNGLRTELRLLKAVYLLRNPAAKIINVAHESGFNHLGLFHATFKRRFGSTPSEWRRLTPPGAGSTVPTPPSVTLRLLDDVSDPAVDGFSSDPGAHRMIVRLAPPPRKLKTDDCASARRAS
jgi:AraC-like DNA-binding protein